MISVTTPTVENGVIVEYKGIVTGQVVNGVNFIKDYGASIRNIVGGRSAGYEEELESARQAALAEMESHAVRLGANAVVGVNIDYEVLGQGNMLMVSATVDGTYVEDPGSAVNVTTAGEPVTLTESTTSATAKFFKIGYGPAE